MEDKKQGGKYITSQSAFKKIDTQKQTITLTEAGEIPVDDIISVEK